LVNLKMNEWTWDLLRDIDTRTLFSNIIDVFNCNFTFWKTYLHPILSCLKANGPNDVIIDTDDLLNGFLDFENLFAPYEQFILEKNNSVEYFKQKLSENEHFSKFITVSAFIFLFWVSSVNINREFVLFGSGPRTIRS
jgi:hypothetical protein